MITLNLSFVNSYAGLVETYFNYDQTSTVTNTNLNGNFDNIRNVLNGGINGDNVSTANGWRLIEILSSSPEAGNQGRVVFLTSNNTLNFDTGSSFITTAVLPNNQTFSGNNTFDGTSTFGGTVTANSSFTANGTTNVIGNGGSDTLTLNVPGGMTLSAATTWTLTGALTFSGTIANLGTVTTADINGGTIAVGGETATGMIIVNNASDDADGLGSQGTSGQFLQSAGVGANPTWVGGVTLLSTTSFSAAALSGNISITAGKRYMVFLKITSGSADQTVYIQFDDDTTATDYNWVIDELLMSTSPTSTLSGDNSDSLVSLGINNSGEGMVCTLFLDTNTFTQTAGNDIGISGQCVGNANDGTGIMRTVAGGYADASTLTTMEFYVNTGNFTGNVILYEM